MKFLTAFIAASFASIALTQTEPSLSGEVSEIVNKIKT
jgi:hypothetical protein